MKRRRSRWLDYLVYLVGPAAWSPSRQMLSIEQSYALARFLAWVLYQVDARHRQVGLENLGHAFGDRFTEARARPDRPRRSTATSA